MKAKKEGWSGEFILGGTKSPELREGKEVVGGAGGHFSRSIPRFPLSPIIVPSPAIGSALSISLFLPKGYLVMNPFS